MSFIPTPEQVRQLEELAKLPDCACIDTDLAELFLGFPPGRRILTNKRAYRTGPPYIRITPRCVRYRMGDLRAWLTANTERVAA